jgi:uncharacterized membrane protein
MALAGLGAWFRLARGGSAGELSRTLLVRGFWLILLEFTLVRAGFFFQIGIDPLFLLVFWALGWSMIALAALIHLPWRALLVVSIAMIALHNLTDGVRASTFGSVAWLWQILHQQSLLMAKPIVVIVAYPLVPWIGVMALGFCAGKIYELDPARRRRLLLTAGLAMIAAFVLLRTWNVYGDPRHWAPQASTAYSVLSFFNATKYPPSLQFLLMTLGPLCLILAAWDSARPRDTHPLIVFGRTPLFYFVVHLPLIHATAIVLTALRYGVTSFLFTPPPTLGTPRKVFPPDYGWDLWVTYAVTLFVVALMYLLCRWFMRATANRGKLLRLLT